MDLVDGQVTGLPAATQLPSLPRSRQSWRRVVGGHRTTGGRARGAQTQAIPTGPARRPWRPDVATGARREDVTGSGDITGGAGGAGGTGDSDSGDPGSAAPTRADHHASDGPRQIR